MVLSRQEVNVDKSTLYFGKGLPNSTAAILSSILDVKEGNQPFIYFGLHIFYGKVRRIRLKAILDKIIMKFSAWKVATLSFMGRLTLIRSVIFGSKLHSFMVYQWHISLLKELEKYIGNFLWSGNVMVTSHMTVNWNKCCKPLKEGGLGLRRPRSLNKVMLVKLDFRIIAEKDFIHDFLRTRFLQKGTLWSCRISSTLWLSLKGPFKDILRSCQWILGDNSFHNFWTDN